MNNFVVSKKTAVDDSIWLTLIRCSTWILTIVHLWGGNHWFDNNSIDGCSIIAEGYNRRKISLVRFDYKRIKSREKRLCIVIVITSFDWVSRRRCSMWRSETRKKQMKWSHNAVGMRLPLEKENIKCIVRRLNDRSFNTIVLYDSSPISQLYIEMTRGIRSIWSFSQQK